MQSKKIIHIIPFFRFPYEGLVLRQLRSSGPNQGSPGLHQGLPGIKEGPEEDRRQGRPCPLEGVRDQPTQPDELPTKSEASSNKGLNYPHAHTIYLVGSEENESLRRLNNLFLGGGVMK